MVRKLVAAAALVLLGVVYVPSAQAGPLTINTPGVVGTVDGTSGYGQGSATFELPLAQFLLDMGEGTTDTTTLVVPKGTGTETLTILYKTSDTEYSGTIPLPYTYATGGKGGLVPIGYDYAIAKYDGPNAGYVLFYLPAYVKEFKTSLLPQDPYELWGKHTGQFEISGFTAFNTTTVPDGGTTAALLGLGMLGLGILRRRIR